MLNESLLLYFPLVKSLSEKISVEQNVVVNEPKKFVLRSKPKGKIYEGLHSLVFFSTLEYDKAWFVSKWTWNLENGNWKHDEALSMECSAG